MYGLPDKEISKNAELSCKTCHLEKEIIYDYTTPILRSLHWSPVKKRIIFKILLPTYRVLNGLVPLYLCDLLQLCKHTRMLHSNSNYGISLVIPGYFTETYDKRAFSICAPGLWNNLPLHLRSPSINIEHFKKELKTFILFYLFN